MKNFVIFCSLTCALAATFFVFNGKAEVKGNSHLTFMGFQLGETRSTTLKNFSGSKFELVSTEDYTKTLYSGRLAFFMIEHPAFCVQTTFESKDNFGILTCADSGAGVSVASLIYANDVLVAIEVSFSKQNSDAIANNVRERYGSTEITIDEKAETAFSNTLKYPGIYSILKEDVKDCQTCHLSQLRQDLEDDTVFSVKNDNQIVGIRLTNKKILSEHLLGHEQLTQREIAAEKKKNSF